MRIDFGSIDATGLINVTLLLDGVSLKHDLKQVVADIDTSEQSWTCVSDTCVTAGGCVIESDTSHVDASMEKRVEQLVDQLGLKTSAGDTDVTE